MTNDLSGLQGVKSIVPPYVNGYRPDYIDCYLRVIVHSGEEWEFSVYWEKGGESLIEAEPQRALNAWSDYEHVNHAPPVEVARVYEAYKPEMELMVLTTRLTGKRL